MAGQRLSQRTGKACNPMAHMRAFQTIWCTGLCTGLRESSDTAAGKSMSAVYVSWRCCCAPELTPAGVLRLFFQRMLNDAKQNDDDFLDLIDGTLQIWRHKTYGESCQRCLMPEVPFGRLPRTDAPWFV